MFDYKQQKYKPRIKVEEEDNDDDKMYVNHFSFEQLSRVCEESVHEISKVERVEASMAKSNDL